MSADAPAEVGAPPSAHQHGHLDHAIECDFDSVIRRFAKVSLDRIEVAHAITFHKAQGSQCSACSDPGAADPALDCTLVYTD